MRSSIAAALAAACVATPAAAQTEHDAQAWPTLSISTDVTDALTLSAETIGRFSADDGLYEAEFSLGATVDVADGVRLTAGYAHLPQFRDGRRTASENRLQPAITFSLGEILGGSASLRLRQEIRFRTSGQDIGWRLRPRLSYSRPFREGGKVEFVAEHESFIELNATDWGQDGGYRRMRNFAGIGFPVIAGVSAEVGYLNQWDIGVDDEPDSFAHVAVLGFAYSF